MPYAVNGGASRKVHCVVCGRQGYPWPEFPAPPLPGSRWWALTCERGHLPCPHCGKQLPVNKSGTRRPHTRCPRLVP